MLFLKKYLNGTVSAYIGNLFRYRHTQYRLRGEGLNFELPKFNHTFKKNSVTFSLTKLWNSWLSQVRLSSDANDFGSKLHDCRFFRTCLTVQNYSF